MSDFRYDRDFLARATDEQLAQEVLNLADSTKSIALNLPDRLAAVEQVAREMLARDAGQVRPLQVLERIEAEQREVREYVGPLRRDE